MLDTKARTDLPVVDEALLRQFTRQCDSILSAVAHSAFSMRTLVSTITPGDCYSLSCLDSLPRARYEDFMCELARAGLELGGDYVGGQPVMIVRRMPKGAQP